VLAAPSVSSCAGWRWAAGLLAAAAVATVVGALTGHPALLEWTSGLFVALLPVATGAAILRYRLYDLDRIISRTLAWGLLTVLLGGGYALVVLGLGQLLGRSSSLVVAAATLAAAAVVRPARRRVQAAVDRRFNRRHYDTARTIEAFAVRLRQHIDLNSLTGFLHKLAAFSRLILLDRLGSGLSDRGPSGQSFEDDMDDVALVLDTVGSQRTAFFGCHLGGRLALLFAQGPGWWSCPAMIICRASATRTPWSP
jgi:hypothetical protein